METTKNGWATRSRSTLSRARRATLKRDETVFMPPTYSSVSDDHYVNVLSRPILTSPDFCFARTSKSILNPHHETRPGPPAGCFSECQLSIQLVISSPCVDEPIAPPPIPGHYPSPRRDVCCRGVLLRLPVARARTCGHADSSADRSGDRTQNRDPSSGAAVVGPAEGSGRGRERARDGGKWTARWMRLLSAADGRFLG